MDSAPSIPNRADTKVEAAGRPRTPLDRRRYPLVRGSPIRSTALWQSQPEPQHAAASQPPERPSQGNIRSISVLLEPEFPPLVAFCWKPERENLPQTPAGSVDHAKADRAGR